MTNWNQNTVSKCKKKQHSDEVLVTVVRKSLERMIDEGGVDNAGRFDE